MAQGSSFPPPISSHSLLLPLFPVTFPRLDLKDVMSLLASHLSLDYLWEFQRQMSICFGFSWEWSSPPTRSRMTCACHRGVRLRWYCCRRLTCGVATGTRPGCSSTYCQLIAWHKCFDFDSATYYSRLIVTKQWFYSYLNSGGNCLVDPPLNPMSGSFFLDCRNSFKGCICCRTFL
jgi:hypothetical protein